MPFDNMPEKKLTLSDLAWRLRHRETWPTGFHWDYSDCYTCAMGLAWRLMSDVSDNWPFATITAHNALRRTIRILADTGPMDTEDLADIFLRLHRDVRRALTQIQPEDVADAIDRYLTVKQNPLGRLGHYLVAA